MTNFCRGQANGSIILRLTASPDTGRVPRPLHVMCPHSRGITCPKFCKKTLPSKSEGAGKTGCTPHPRSRVQWVDSGRTRAYRFGGVTPAFPAQRLYGLYEFAPVTGFLATVIPGKRWLPLRLDASTGASGPHDFTVRSGIVRPHIAARNTIASIATSPNVCDDGRRPSGGKGWREF
jgi:hypothetical protein